MQTTKQSIITIIIGFVILAGVNFVYSFTEPTQDPPEGNVPAPINVGPGTQTKTGNLNILGNLGIGTENPDSSKGSSGYLTVSDIYLDDISKWISELDPEAAPALWNGLSSGSGTGITDWITVDSYDFETTSDGSLFLNLDYSLQAAGQINIGTESRDGCGYACYVYMRLVLDDSITVSSYSCRGDSYWYTAPDILDPYCVSRSNTCTSSPAISQDITSSGAHNLKIQYSADGYCASTSGSLEWVGEERL